MADTQKETPANDEPPKNDNPPANPAGNEGSNGAPGGAGTSGTSDTTEEIRKVVREEIAAALKGVRQGGNGDGTPPVKPVNLEAEAERMVREATEKLEAEKQHKADHEQLRNGAKPPETAPQKARRLTRALWGSDDK